MNNLLIVTAMSPEHRKSVFKGAPTFSIKNLEFYRVDSTNLYYVVTGIGKINAAISLTEYLQHCAASDVRFDHILNIGFAGATEDLENQQVIISKVYDMDAHTSGLSDLCDSIDLTTQGVECYSSQSFVTGTDVLALGKSTAVFDMECYALAKVAKRYNIPFTSIKIISDCPTKNDIGHFEKFVENYGDFTELILKFIKNN